MSKTQDSTEQIKFLVSCIHNATGGKPNFQAVADQLGIVTKAAAQKRYERLLKAHGVGAPTKSPNGTEESEVPPATPKRKAAPRRAPKSSKKKLKRDEESTGSDEDIKKRAKKEKAESPVASDLSDAPASADESA
ncbi:hypothetical protein G6O67_001481 [Ophiocordyceps sinensis]|uniref:Myb-like DNA-binding domain-containing protein n=2 Tax=Ophiocordyceps sinensis TaxID=72228 RepID=A0A8H4PXL6_9HYPO|nr:hypothetical protein OCS_02140 [Ophiocordyceps sinensis CO18]KAF4512324.1 hypothetical protein G6O67_001481 [Ophiocordyceps sinensis]